MSSMDRAQGLSLRLVLALNLQILLSHSVLLVYTNSTDPITLTLSSRSRMPTRKNTKSIEKMEQVSKVVDYR